MEDVFEEQEVDFGLRLDPQPSFNVAGSADQEILQFHCNISGSTPACPL
jgi:hypothetical protein